MEQPTHRYFTTLTELIRKATDNIRLNHIESDSRRTLWELHGSLGESDIFIKEVFMQKGRMYSYYLIRKGEVVVGFDNYPDRKALRLKYNLEFASHLDELIPHRHDKNKTILELTEEMTVERFLKHLYHALKGESP